MLANIADRIAEKWVEEHYQEVAAAINPQAVANLVTAEAAAEVAKEVRRTTPERVREVVKREVYQRGVFGGVKRIL